MSIEALNWAWEQTAPTSTAKLVLVALANHANSDNECWPKMSYIAERAQCSPRQVSRCVDSLEAAGLVTKKRRRLSAGRLGSYVFLLPVGQQQLPDIGDQKTPTSSGHPRPVDADDQWTPTAPTTGHPRPSPPDTSVRTEPSVEPPVNPKGARKRATQLPADWQPTDKHRELARELGVDVDRERPQFEDHHAAKGSAFKDWDRAFNTWLRNAQKFGNVKTAPGKGGRRAGVTFDV